MYSPWPFAIAQGNVEMPYLVAQTLIYSCIVYWMVGFAPVASKFFWFVLIFGLTLMMFTAYGIMCINLTPEMGLAGLFLSFFFGFWNLLCGFLIAQPFIPGWWIWCAPREWGGGRAVVGSVGHQCEPTAASPHPGVLCRAPRHFTFPPHPLAGATGSTPSPTRCTASSSRSWATSPPPTSPTSPARSSPSPRSWSSALATSTACGCPSSSSCSPLC